MPNLVEQIEAILQRKLTRVSGREGDPLFNLMPVKTDTPKYALDAEGKRVIGLNLARMGVTDGQWDKIIALPELAERLQALNLCENELTQISLPAAMRSLRFLHLAENKRLQYVDLETLHHTVPLEWLDLSECALTSFTLPSLLDLQKFDISRNQLTELVMRGNCGALFLLDASHNQLTSFELWGSFAALKYLYLNDNQLQDLLFKDILKMLEFLHLRNNKLEYLPHLLPFTQMKTLFLHGNPMSAMRDVISGDEHGNSWEAVCAYQLSQTKSKLVFLHQAKMILVGNGEVGKTSIRIKLLDKKAPLPAKHERTPGLEIWPYPVKNLETRITGLHAAIDFQLNIWDFGGQGKYREVQQIFCNRKTLYLFVTAHDDLPQKEDYVGFEYWLSMVNAYSLDDSDSRPSPVIHVVNKIDEHEMPVNERDRQAIFSNITRFVKISCETLRNFEQLEAAIREVLPQVSPDMFTAQFTEYWLAVKSELERRQSDNHITKAEYLQICADNQLDEVEAENWIRILDRIGTVIYFGENKELQDWVILNPSWVKQALYDVLDNQALIAEGGILKEYVLTEIWKDRSPEERQHLIRLMLAYKLCYQQKDARGKVEYVVPALLYDTAPQLPDHLQKPDYRLKFTFSPFLPAGTVNKLMVMLHDGSNAIMRASGSEGASEKMERSLEIEMNKDYLWKNNVIARDVEHNVYAHVREDWEGKTVCLDFFGKNARPLFEYIHSALESINQTLKATRHMAQLNLESWAWHEAEWERMDKLKKFGVAFFPANSIPTIAEKKKLRVFVCYAHLEDSRYMKLFVEGIKAHSDWEIFNDHQILIGQDWHKRLQKEVAECDFGILLISPGFFKSEYIQQHEFGQFIKREGFPLFGMLLVDCDFKNKEGISEKQIFVAHGQDYNLAQEYRDQQISFDNLAQFDSNKGEVIPNSYRNKFCKNFVASVNQVLQTG